MAAITLLLETQNPNRDNETISRFVLCSIISGRVLCSTFISYFAVVLIGTKKYIRVTCCFTDCQGIVRFVLITYVKFLHAE